MGNIIVMLIIAVAIGGAAYKVYKDKKNHVTCCGCPMKNQCASQESGCSSQSFKIK